MPFLSSKKNLFLFSDKKSSEILPENIAEKFDVITVSSDLKLLENFETFFESLEETVVFFDYSFIKYEILENKFFKWLNKTFVPVILLVYRNDLQIMFEKNVNLSKFIVLPEEQTQNLYSNSEEYDDLVMKHIKERAKKLTLNFLKTLQKKKKFQKLLLGFQ